MHRRALILAWPLLAVPPAARAQAAPAPAASAPAALAPADRADIARIETYLNALKTLKARFLQIAPDGSTSQGTAWLERPGRMRFEYDKPSPLLLVAGHGLLVFHDAQLQQTTNLPLSSTALGLLLQDNLKLSGDVTVTSIARQPGQIQISVVRTASPGDGSLTLVFADAPLELRQWAVTDPQRRETRISLFSIEQGGSFPSSLFEFIAPRLPGNGG